MIVTDLQYNLEPRFVKKLDIMIDRCERAKVKKDAVLINEGAEGEGKTNTSLLEAYYVRYNTSRPIHLFFNLEPLIKFAQSTESKVIIWDEPSLDSLSTDHLNVINKDLIRLLMTVRIKRHFLIFNFTKFYKFSEYIIVDRALGMVHMYSRKEIEPGRFLYIKKKNLERLYLDYKKSKKRMYKRYGTIRGKFPEIMSKHFSKMGITVNNIPNATLEDYESEKHKAIKSIGTTTKNKANKDKTALKLLKFKISQLRPPVLSLEQMAKVLGVNERQLQRWRNIDINSENDDNPQENEVFEVGDDATL